MDGEPIYIVIVADLEGYGEIETFPFRSLKDAEDKAVSIANDHGYEVESFDKIDIVRQDSDGFMFIDIEIKTIQ